MESPQRSGLSDSEIYFCFDSEKIILFVGRNTDPNYLTELF